MKVNILNKTGMLSKKDRKEPLEHGCNHFVFKTCLDLSEPIKVTPFGKHLCSVYSLEDYSQDLSIFMTWWEHFVKPGLNGFSGFSNVKFEIDVKLV